MPLNYVFVIELKFRECWAVFSCGIRGAGFLTASGTIKPKDSIEIMSQKVDWIALRSRPRADLIHSALTFWILRYYEIVCSTEFNGIYIEELILEFVSLLMLQQGKYVSYKLSRLTYCSSSFRCGVISTLSHYCVHKEKVQNCS
jgi:hypothetical protein